MTSWYNNAWVHRKSHAITESLGAGTNYQMMITVNKGVGVDSGNNVYLGGLCLDNFGDIRFTADDGITLLDYWIESYVSGISAVIWVEVSADLGSNQTIYIYYDNSGATTTSNGDNTFLLFDDFLGSSLDTNKWVSWIAGNGNVTVNNGLTLYDPAQLNCGAGIRSIVTFTNKALRFKGTYDDGATGIYQALGFNLGTDGTSINDLIVGLMWNAEDGRLYTAKTPSSTSTSVTIGKTVSHIYDVTWMLNRAELLKDGGSLAIHTTNIQTSANYVFPRIWTYNGNPAVTTTTTIAWVCVRNFIYPEPANSTWGSEETRPASTVQVDVLFKELNITKTNSIDVLLKELNIPKFLSYNIDTFIRNLVTTKFLSYNIDAFIRNLTITKTKTNSIDVLLNVLYPYKIDVDLMGVANISDSIDTLFEMSVPRTYLIDTILSRIRFYSIDTLLKMLNVPVQYAIDIDLKKYGVQVQYAIDSRFVHTLTSTYAIDTLIQVTNSSIELTDSLFKKKAITTSIGIDTTLLSVVPPIPPIYTQPTLMFSNPNGTLWGFPLTWKETQDCTPAIRRIPLAESEYLDKDSYVLKPREINVTLRLSDTEKDLLEKIYAFADTSGANDFTDIYLFYNNTDSDAGVHPKPPPRVKQYTWHHTAWLSNKDYKYEYAYQDGRYVRWWTVTLTINVQSFSGSSARPPDYQPFAWAVVLDGHKLAHIIDFVRSDKHPPMLPEWVNQPAEVDSYLWNECVLDLTYTDRMSNDEKYLMDITLQNHQLVSLADYIHNIVGNVWVSSISAEYDSTNWKKPWKVDITLQANNSDINFASTANLSVDSWGTSTNGGHIGPDGLGTLYMDEVQTPLTLSERIENGDFENDTAGWIFTSGNSHIESGTYHSPTHAVLTHSDGTGFYQNITPIAGSDITHITFWMSAPYGHATIYVDVGYTDGTFNAESFDSEDPDFAKMAVYFNASKTVNKLTFRSDGNPSYIDDVSLIATSSTSVVSVGVHVFYFFLPTTAQGFYRWNVTGNAIIVGENTSESAIGYSLDIQTFDRESRISVLIYGDCSITVEYIVN